MHILLTGGGTAGHVIPNIAIAEAIRIANPKARISYIGSTHGIERGLCEGADIPFYAIQTGKLRRYFSIHNFFDFFQVPVGMVQAFFRLLHLRPNVVFSKGGFVGFPVVFAAWLIGIPVIIHESDAIPGLATKLSAPFAKKIFLGFEEAVRPLDHYAKKLEVVGNPIRLDLEDGEAKKGLKWAGFSGKRPVLLVMGGSGGSEQLNELMEKEREDLLREFDVLHVTGEGKSSAKPSRPQKKHYIAVPFLKKELKDVLAMTSMVICRAGANTLAELEALQIPALLYPLGRHASRGDQLVNAKALCKRSSLFIVAEENRPAMPQLLLLPPRRSGAEPLSPKENATQKIAFTLLSDLKQL